MAPTPNEERRPGRENSIRKKKLPDVAGARCIGLGNDILGHHGIRFQDAMDACHRGFHINRSARYLHIPSCENFEGSRGLR